MRFFKGAKEYLFISLSVLLLGGCVPKISKVGEIKHYDIKNEVLDNTPSYADINASSLNKEWWKIYHDEQLDNIIEKAINDAPSIKSVEARYVAANELVESIKAKIYAADIRSRSPIQGEI